MSKFYCSSPFVATRQTAYDKISPCAFGPIEVQGDHDMSQKDRWNHPALADLRNKFLAGEKPTECKRCWDEEDAGINSKRISFAEHFSGDDTIPDTLFTDPVTEKNIQYVDLKLGNVCNLKCRICNSMSSSNGSRLVLLQ